MACPHEGKQCLAECGPSVSQPTDTVRLERQIRSADRATYEIRKYHDLYLALIDFELVQAPR